jgi:hypothetical protein
MEGWIWEEIQHFLHGLNNQRGEIIACPHKPNGLGLYDMSGNVWELGADWYDKDYYKGSPKNNPQGPGSGKHRVVRGGSWNPNPGGLARVVPDLDAPIVFGRRSQLSGGIFCPVAIF